jgi:tellurite resistance protein
MSAPLRPSTPPNPRVARANLDEIHKKVRQGTEAPGLGAKASNADKDIAAKKRNENPALWLSQAHPDYACKVLDTAFHISTEGGAGEAVEQAAERMLCQVFDLYGVSDDSSN